MRSLSVTQAKAHLSALLDAVEVSEEVEITRRGGPVARLTGTHKDATSAFDLEALLASVMEQPLHPGEISEWIRELRSEARY